MQCERQPDGQERSFAELYRSARQMTFLSVPGPNQEMFLVRGGWSQYNIRLQE